VIRVGRYFWMVAFVAAIVGVVLGTLLHDAVS